MLLVSLGDRKPGHDYHVPHLCCGSIVMDKARSYRGYDGHPAVLQPPTVVPAAGDAIDTTIKAN